MGQLLAWHAMPGQEVLRNQGSRSEGLAEDEVQRRLATAGQNVLPRASQTRAIKFLLRQFRSPLVLVLVVAAAISITLGRPRDAVLTLLIVVMNAFLGFVQEYRADRSLARLAQRLEQQATVRRGGTVVRVAAAQIVPGDVLLLSAGDKVVADARLLKVQSLETNEASLTGESSAIKKQAEPVASEVLVQERFSMVYAGTTISAGTGEAVVVATGIATEFGQVAGMVSKVADETTPLEKELYHFSRIIVGLALIAASLVALLGVVRQLPLLTILGVAAALAVAVVPEGLMVSLTVILSLGMRRVYKKHALVRRLVAAETLGSVSVVCVDKTGTLTTGEMTVTEMRHGVHLVNPVMIDEGDKELFSALAAFIDQENGASIRKSATQDALRKYFYSLPPAARPSAITIVEQLPFEATQKFSARAVNENGTTVWYVLGAPDVLLARADVDDATRQACNATLSDMTRRGLRVLLLAAKSHGVEGPLAPEKLTDLMPVGFIGLEDPLRPGARETLAEAAAAGIRVVMVTGDHPETAAAVGRALGLLTTSKEVLNGNEIAQLSEAEFTRRITEVTVFARVLPEQKMKIVRAFQARGFSVAMTGDGVNDAPALKAAEIGIAVDGGTDVAKETADMVLLDNDIKAIIESIREGRRMYDNIRKVILYLVTFSLTEVALITGVLLVGLPVPFAPLHILWINIATDGMPAMALAGEPAESTIMREPPRRRGEPLVNPGMRNLMILAGSVSVILILTLYLVASLVGLSVETVRTIVFLSLGFNSLVSIFVLRIFRKPVWSVAFFANPLLLLAVLSSALLLLLPVLVPSLAEDFGFALFPGVWWGIIVAVAIIKLFAIELGKYWFLQPPRAQTAHLLQ